MKLISEKNAGIFKKNAFFCKIYFKSSFKGTKNIQTKNCAHGLLRSMGYLFSSESNGTPKTQTNNSRAVVRLRCWCSTQPSADRVINQDRTHCHQLVIAMLKSSSIMSFYRRSPMVKPSYHEDFTMAIVNS